MKLTLERMELRKLEMEDEVQKLEQNRLATVAEISKTQEQLTKL